MDMAAYNLFWIIPALVLGAVVGELFKRPRLSPALWGLVGAAITVAIFTAALGFSHKVYPAASFAVRGLFGAVILLVLWALWLRNMRPLTPAGAALMLWLTATVWVGARLWFGSAVHLPASILFGIMLAGLACICYATMVEPPAEGAEPLRDLPTTRRPSGIWVH